MLPKLVPLAVLAVVASQGTTLAQSAVEITPFFGLRSQGAFRSGEATDNVVLEVDNSASYGVFFDYGLTDYLKIDVLWARQRSQVLEGARPMVEVPAQNTTPTTATGDPLFDISVDYVHGGVLYGGGNEAFSAYAAAGAGVAIFNPDVPDFSSLKRFSFSLGAGFRSKFSERLGFRFDARVFGARAGQRREDVACGVFGCASFESASTFWQTHFVGGLIISL